jgi:exocyst complex component 5
MLDRFANQIQSNTNPSLDSLKKLAGLERKRERDEKTTEPEFSEQDGVLNVEAAKRMLKWHAEAIGRAVELTPHADLYVVSALFSNLSRAKDSQNLMTILFDYIGKAYTETALDQYVPGGVMLKA